MKICIPITYYTPNVSGLTLYCRRLIELLSADGHEIVVVTNHHACEAPVFESDGRVSIVRVPVLFQIDQFVYAPGFRTALEEQLPQADLVIAQLPMMPQEVRAIRLACARYEIPLIVQYQCDVTRGGPLGAFATGILQRENRKLCAVARQLWVLSDDYAGSNPVLADFPQRCKEVPPLALDVDAASNNIESMRSRYVRDEELLIGCVGRFSSEKGHEYLLQAIPLLEQRLPRFKVVFVCDSTKVIGNAAHRARLEALVAAAGDRCAVTGFLSETELAAFYAACDVTVLPSLGAPEAYGLVQVESMLMGTPVVATSLPGVRIPIERSGMGVLVQPGSASAIADGICRALELTDSQLLAKSQVRERFGIDSAPLRFRQLLEELPAQPAEETTPTQQRLLNRMLGHTPAFSAMVRSVEAAILQRSAPFPIPVLDIGCERGDFSRYILRDSISLDVRFAPLRAAQRVLSGATVLQADCCTLPLSDCSMKTIVCNSALEHVPDLNAALSELKRVLHQDGQFHLTVPTDAFAKLLGGAQLLDACGLAGLSASYQRWFNRLSKHYHFYSADRWQELLELAGFAITERKPYLNARSHRYFDLLHVLGLPRLASRAVSDRWVLSQSLSLNCLYQPLLAKLTAHSAEQVQADAAPYCYFRCEPRRTGALCN